MDIYRVKYENVEDGDLYGISIVDDPANKFEFIALSEYKSVKMSSDEKKKILYGIVLRADQKIYREFEDGTPYYLVFDAPTIERFSQDFMRKGYQRNSTYNHDDNKWLDDSTVVEQWIVMNKENDKGSEIGLPVEQGDWVIGMKLSDQLWSEYVETGKAKGFSIDSFIQFEKINMKNIESTDSNNPDGYKKEKSIMKNIFTKIVELFNAEGVTNLATLTTSIGDLTADAFEIGQVVYNADGQPVIDAEFQFENKAYKTDNAGLIVEISDVMEEQSDNVDNPTNMLEEKLAEETNLEDVNPDVVATVDETVTAITDEITNPVEQVDVEALKLEIETLKAELEKITKQQNEVLMENTKLKETMVSTKLKAEVKGASPITMKAQETSDDSILSAIERITKKINK